MKKMNELDTYHRYGNILNRDFSAEKANQKWVTDITYVRTQQGWAYLSTIKDLFDGFIVAHQLGKRNSVRLVTDTLKKSKSKEKITEKLLLHSDQRYQHTSRAYFLLTKRIQDHALHVTAWQLLGQCFNGEFLWTFQRRSLASVPDSNLSTNTGNC